MSWLRTSGSDHPELSQGQENDQNRNGITGSLCELEHSRYEHDAKPRARQASHLNATESFAENQARKKNRARGVQRGQCGGDGQHAMTCGKKVEYVCEDVERRRHRRSATPSRAQCATAAVARARRRRGRQARPLSPKAAARGWRWRYFA